MVELDNTQRRAVESEAKTIIVNGDPGSGKTRILTERFAYLVRSRRVPLSSILVFTFSSSSAAQFRRMIEERIQQSYDELWVHTYHSFSNHILTEYSSFADAPRPLELVSPFREYLFVKELLRAEQAYLKSDFRVIAFKDGAARELSDFFGLLRQNLIGPALFHEITRNLTPQLSDLARIYFAYGRCLSEQNQIGIRDVVSCALEILENQPKLLAQYRNKFSHVLVDEFQEIDPAQLRLLKLTASAQTSLFIAGDENQRIYRFRGSATNQFSDIAVVRKDVEAIRLEKNYRLTPEVRKASASLMGFNGEREFHTTPADLGGELIVVKYEDPIEQAYAVAREIKGKVLDSTSSPSPIRYSDFAVICRSTYRSGLPLQEAFSYYGIPHIVYNCTSFYQHPMVRLTADFLRLLGDPDNNEILLRVLSIPAFRLDAVKLRRLSNGRKLWGSVSLYESICKTLRGGSSATLDISDEETATALTAFISYFEDIRQKVLAMERPSALVYSIMQKLFYKQILEARGTDAGIRDAQNLRSLYEAVGDIEQVFSEVRGKCALSDVVEYMEHAFAHFSSQQENDPADQAGEGVRIMTVHQAKGLEFPFVFLVDMTDEYFPSFRGGSCLLDTESLDTLRNALRKSTRKGTLSACNFQFMMTPQEQLKEERHLAYVAATRSSQKLTICFTAESHFPEPVKPSPFIEELVGRDPEVFLEERQRSDSNDGRALLESSLNTQEIESALRMCVHTPELGAKGESELFRFLESLGLDAKFICSEFPFEPEPRQAPSLTDHRYSATQLTTYLACPRQFFFERILRIAPERPEDFGLGQLIHRVLEKFHNEVKTFSGYLEPLEARLVEVFQTVWEGAGNEGSQIDAVCNQFPTLLQRAAIARRAEEILHRYLKTESAQAAGRKIVACEELITFTVRDYPFTARIDRIDVSAAGNHIIDYKTSGAGPKGAMSIKKKFLNIEQKPDYTPEDFQLPLYLLAGRAAGYDPVELSYYWVSQEDSSGMFKKSSLRICDDRDDCLTPEDMQAAEEGIVEVVKRIASGNFASDPKSSYICSRCSFDFICNAQEQDVTEND